MSVSLATVLHHLKLDVSEHEVALRLLNHNVLVVVFIVVVIAATTTLTCTEEGDEENRKKYLPKSFRIYTLHLILFAD
jgi:hypothetical protein